ncbi:MAG: hypothetical protein WBQ82_05175 [Methyloceanibacter sp.]
MRARKMPLAVAMLFAGVGLAGEASAKIYVDNGSLVDGDTRHEILKTSPNTCASDKLEFGTNDGLVQVGKFKEMPKVEGFITHQINWRCGNGGYSHTECPLEADKMWVSRKLGTYFVLFCVGNTVGVGH